ncbi:MAG: hypothetical protein K9K68_02370 [Methylococcaceae bacterium]|nr:hypothetical protein [Methylococcaceae bacterium]
MTAKTTKSKSPQPGPQSQTPAKIEGEKKVSKAKLTKPLTADAATKPVAKPANTATKLSPGAAAEVEKGEYEVKHKLVRDSFKFPQQEYLAFHALKARCLEAGLVVKKSELVRAGLIGLLTLTDEQLIELISGLEKLKAGRPAK